MNSQAIASRLHGALARGKTLMLLTVIACGFLFGSCEKRDDDDGLIELLVEPMGGGHSKVLLDGADATWLDGDIIRINGENVEVVRRNGRAYASYATPQSVNRAVYPASLNSGSLGSDNVTINFPAYYHYRADNSGHQILELPMAARSEDDDPLRFKHLTGALYVTVTNTATVPLTLQSVTVQSNRYQLNGTRNIDLSDLENIGSVATATTDNRKVTLVFDTGYTLAADASLKVMLPVMPVGSDHNFTIQVKSYTEGQSTSYLKSQTQTGDSDHSLIRNQLGYAPISITSSGSTTAVLESHYDKDSRKTTYLLYSPNDFKLMVDAIRNSWFPNDAKYSIVEDIDMTGIPITTITNSSFVGTIDGNNHTVSNLTINSVKLSGTCYCALFHNAGKDITLTDLHLYNLTLNAQNVGSSTLKMAGLIADNTSVSGTLTINNCSVNISSVNIGGATGTIYFGGLFGSVDAATSFTNCHVSTSSPIAINGNNVWGGGLMGYTGSVKTEMHSSSWNGEISFNATTNIRAGGFIGWKVGTQRLILSDCSVTGAIRAEASGSYQYPGTLVGFLSTSTLVDTTRITKTATLTLNNTVIASKTFGNQ